MFGCGTLEQNCKYSQQATTLFKDALKLNSQIVAYACLCFLKYWRKSRSKIMREVSTSKILIIYLLSSYF